MADTGNIYSRWVGGDLAFFDAAGHELLRFDAADRAVKVPSGGSFQVAGVTVDASTLALNGLTATAAELNKAHGLNAGAALAVLESVLFTQTTGDGTYTGTIALPAGARILDIGVDAQAQWNASTSASMVVGDGNSANGFFLATDLVATDLLAGEINNIEHPGGKAGAYIAAEQRVLYSASARSVIGVITQVGTGTQGRTRLYCMYAVAVAANATKA